MDSPDLLSRVMLCLCSGERELSLSAALGLLISSRSSHRALISYYYEVVAYHYPPYEIVRGFDSSVLEGVLKLLPKSACDYSLVLAATAVCSPLLPEIVRTHIITVRPNLGVLGYDIGRYSLPSLGRAFDTFRDTLLVLKEFAGDEIVFRSLYWYVWADISEADYQLLESMREQLSLNPKTESIQHFYSHDSVASVGSLVLYDLSKTPLDMEVLEYLLKRVSPTALSERSGLRRIAVKLFREIADRLESE